ncbi:hypothetical protein D3C76_1444890 [compost metagenome]
MHCPLSVVFIGECLAVQVFNRLRQPCRNANVLDDGVHSQLVNLLIPVQPQPHLVVGEADDDIDSCGLAFGSKGDRIDE